MSESVISKMTFCIMLIFMFRGPEYAQHANDAQVKGLLISVQLLQLKITIYTPLTPEQNHHFDYS